MRGGQFTRPVAALAAVLILAAGGPVSAKVVTITWSTFLGGDQLKEELELIASFEHDNPDIKVRVLTGVQPDKILTMFVAGTAPDVVHTTRADAFLRRGLLLDVTKYFKASKFDFSDYLPFTNSYRREGKIFGGLETHTQAYPFFYNATAFREVGVSTPSELVAKGDWNWNSFLTCAKRLTRDTNGDGKSEKWGFRTGVLWEGSWLQWLLLGGRNYYNERTNKVDMTDAKSVEAMRFYSSLVLEHKVAPTYCSVGEDSFPKGQIGMMMYGTWLLNRYTATKMKFDWDIAYPPTGATSDASQIVGSDGLILRSTKHPKEAFRLVQFFMGERCQLQKGKSKLVVPVLRSALASKEFLSAPPASMSIIPKMLETATQQPFFLGETEVTNVIEAAIAQMMFGRKSVPESLKTATTESNRILARYKK